MLELLISMFTSIWYICLAIVIIGLVSIITVIGLYELEQYKARKATLKAIKDNIDEIASHDVNSVN